MSLLFLLSHNVSVWSTAILSYFQSHQLVGVRCLTNLLSNVSPVLYTYISKFSPQIPIFYSEWETVPVGEEGEYRRLALCRSMILQDQSCSVAGLFQSLYELKMKCENLEGALTWKVPAQCPALKDVNILWNRGVKCTVWYRTWTPTFSSLIDDEFQNDKSTQRSSINWQLWQVYISYPMLGLTCPR